MRDQARIVRITEKLQDYWLQVPDWRLGQLLDNLRYFIGAEDLFYIEDDVLEQGLENFFLEMELKGEL